MSTTDIPPLVLQVVDDIDGIQVACFGEDCNLVAIGHHEPYRAAQAFAAYGPWSLVLPGDIRTTWAVVEEPATPEPSHDEPFLLQWGAAPDEPGAFPVMVLEA